MASDRSPQKITLFDTTLRDGELAPSVQFTTRQKMQLAKLLEQMGVDVIEAGYPGAFRKDFDALFMISKQTKASIVCGLANSTPDEVINVALAIKPAMQGRIHIYTPFSIQSQTQSLQDEHLDRIRNSIQLARNYRDDVEWSAFNALHRDRDFLCRSLETAIRSGATTVNIADTLGDASAETFCELIQTVMNRVPNIDQATVAVHCHNDLGLAVANSIAALSVGVRQIECAVNGLGARKGNADLSRVVNEIAHHPGFYTTIQVDLLYQASELVKQITGVAPGY
jgi:2-isopropylmalate synthase